MAKHGITIPSRRLNLTERVEHPDVRQQRISEQVARYLSGGGEIEKIDRGVSNGGDSIAKLHMSAAAKRRMNGMKI